MKKLRSGDHVVDSDYVSKNQDRLIYHTDFSQLAELIDVRPSPGSVFIRSMSEPFEEDDVQDEVLRNWISSFKMSFHQAHASGHASKSEIFNMIRSVSPKVVIPVHTEHADLFSRCGRKVSCPQPEKCMQLR